MNNNSAHILGVVFRIQLNELMYLKFSESVRHIELGIITMKNQTNELRALGNWSGIWEKDVPPGNRRRLSERSELRLPKKCFDKTLKWKMLFWVSPAFTFFVQLVLFKMYASYFLYSMFILVNY